MSDDFLSPSAYLQETEQNPFNELIEAFIAHLEGDPLVAVNSEHEMEMINNGTRDIPTLFQEFYFLHYDERYLKKALVTRLGLGTFADFKKLFWQEVVKRNLIEVIYQSSETEIKTNEVELGFFDILELYIRIHYRRYNPPPVTDSNLLVQIKRTSAPIPDYFMEEFVKHFPEIRDSVRTDRELANILELQVSQLRNFFWARAKEYYLNSSRKNPLRGGSAPAAEHSLPPDLARSIQAKWQEYFFNSLNLARLMSLKTNSLPSEAVITLPKIVRATQCNYQQACTVFFNLLQEKQRNFEP